MQFLNNLFAGGDQDIQSSVTMALTTLFIVSGIIVGLIWITKRSPSFVSLLLYGVGCLLLCLPISRAVHYAQETESQVNATAVPYNMYAARSRAHSTPLFIAEPGEIYKGDVLLQLSSPESDARLRALDSEMQKLEIEKHIAETSPQPTTGVGTAPNSIDNRLMLLEASEREYSSGIRMLERQRLPLLRDLSRLDLETQSAEIELKQFRDLLSKNFATPAEVTIKEKNVSRLAGDAQSYRAHLQVIDNEIVELKGKLAELKVDKKQKNLTAKNVAVGSGTEDEQDQEQMRLTQLNLINLRINAVQLERDAIKSSLIHRAPCDGVVLWKHPSPESVVPSTPLVVMSPTGESGIMIKTTGPLSTQGPLPAAARFEVIYGGLGNQQSEFTADARLHSKFGLQGQGGADFLLTSMPPASLIQELLTGRPLPVQISLSGGQMGVAQSTAPPAIQMPNDNLQQTPGIEGPGFDIPRIETPGIETARSTAPTGVVPSTELSVMQLTADRFRETARLTEPIEAPPSNGLTVIRLTAGNNQKTAERAE